MCCKYPSLSNISYFTSDKLEKSKATWLLDANFSDFTPWQQVSGLVFNLKREILLINESDKWIIPGGTPESAESPKETLCREILEEAGVSILKSFPLGVHKIEVIENRLFPKEPVYQYRFICLLDSVLFQGREPDTKKVNPRIFVPLERAIKLLPWGNAGTAMLNDAGKRFKELYPHITRQARLQV